MHIFMEMIYLQVSPFFILSPVEYFNGVVRYRRVQKYCYQTPKQCIQPRPHNQIQVGH